MRKKGDALSDKKKGTTNNYYGVGASQNFTARDECRDICTWFPMKVGPRVKELFVKSLHFRKLPRRRRSCFTTSYSISAALLRRVKSPATKEAEIIVYSGA